MMKPINHHMSVLSLTLTCARSLQEAGRVPVSWLLCSWMLDICSRQGRSGGDRFQPASLVWLEPSLKELHDHFA